MCLLQPRLKVFFYTLLRVKTGRIVVWQPTRPHFSLQRGKIALSFLNPLECQKLHTARGLFQ